MNISRLELTNFRSARGLALDLSAPKIIIAGKNEAGKTSIRESIRWVLRGVCDGTDGKGAGAEALIPTGAKEASVAVEVSGIGKVSRTFLPQGGTAFSVEGFTGASQTQQQALYAKLATTPAYLDSVMETEAFLRLHHADAKALVLQLLDVKVTIPDAIAPQKDGDPCAQWTLDELDIRYKQAFEARKDAKRRLQALGIPQAPVMPEDVQAAQERLIAVGQGTVSVAEAARTLIENIRKDLGSKEREVGAVAGQRRALEQEQARLQATIDAGVPKDDGAGSHLETLRAELEALTGEAEAPAGFNLPASNLVTLRTKAETLAAHQPANGCVLDGEVPCKTPLKAFSARAADLQAKIAAIPTEQMTGKQRMQVRDLEKRIAEASDALKANEKQRAAYAAANLRMEPLKAELAGLPSTAEAEAAIEALRGRIRKGEAIVEKATAYEKAYADYEAAKTARAALEAQVATLETRVEMLGPSGLRVVALAEAMGKFEAAINTWTQPWGWTVKIQAEPWTVLVNDRPVETYSKSGRYRIGIAVQMAVAALSGLSFAIIDELDMLDDENRRALLRMVKDAPLEQIVVLTTWGDEKPMPPAMPEWIMYRLRQIDGRSQIAETVRAEVAA